MGKLRCYIQRSARGYKHRFVGPASIMWPSGSSSLAGGASQKALAAPNSQQRGHRPRSHLLAYGARGKALGSTSGGPAVPAVPIPLARFLSMHLAALLLSSA